jgi:hypothetical protein
MDRKVAEELMRTCLAISQPLNAATQLTDGIANGAERESVRRVIGNLMQTVHLELMRPIIRQYPDLDPDQTVPT